MQAFQRGLQGTALALVPQWIHGREHDDAGARKWSRLRLGVPDGHNRERMTVGKGLRYLQTR